MPGPAPKDPTTRARRNKVPGARTLHPVARPPKAPALPTRQIDGQFVSWRKPTRDWWERAWSSPMSAEWDPSDVDGLFILAVLVDDFWRDPTPARAAEIRLQSQRYGLSPIDRRRLQWEIDRGEEAQQRTKQRRAPKAVKAKDPRAG